MPSFFFQSFANMSTHQAMSTLWKQWTCRLPKETQSVSKAYFSRERPQINSLENIFCPIVFSMQFTIPVLMVQIIIHSFDAPLFRQVISAELYVCCRDVLQVRFLSFFWWVLINWAVALVTLWCNVRLRKWKSTLFPSYLMRLSRQSNLTFSNLDYRILSVHQK